MAIYITAVKTRGGGVIDREFNMFTDDPSGVYDQRFRYTMRNTAVHVYSNGCAYNYRDAENVAKSFLYNPMMRFVMVDNAEPVPVFDHAYNVVVLRGTKSAGELYQFNFKGSKLIPHHQIERIDLGMYGRGFVFADTVYKAIGFNVTLGRDRSIYTLPGVTTTTIDIERAMLAMQKKEVYN